MITPNQIAVALGRSLGEVSPPELAQWQMWIDEARLLILDRFGDLSLLDQNMLDLVTRWAVVDLAKRPDNATQVDVAVDGMNVSKRYSTSTGRVTILDDWWAKLAPINSGSSGAFSIDLYGGRCAYGW